MKYGKMCYDDRGGAFHSAGVGKTGTIYTYHIYSILHFFPQIAIGKEAKSGKHFNKKGNAPRSTRRNGCDEMKSMTEYPAFGVLAGGKSSRMGTDKARLMLEGKTFLETVLAAGGAFRERLASFSSDADEADMAPIRAMGVTTVNDELEDRGPLEGIRQILLHMKSRACLICATDMPFVTPELLQALAGRYCGSGNLVLRFEGRDEPLCSIYGRECLPFIDELYRRQCRRPALLFSCVQTQYVCLEELGFSAETIRNVNDEKEYRAITGRESGYLCSVPCRKLCGGRWQDSEISLAAECTLRIRVNGSCLPESICSPAGLRELVTGRLITEGLIREARQITRLSLDESGLPERADAEVYTDGAAAEGRSLHSVPWDGQTLKTLSDYVVKDARKNRGSHSTHSCTLLYGGQIVCSREDIGRHNAIDRAIGWAAMNGIPAEECAAFFSGRISAEAVRKMANAGVGVLCAKALPTQKAVACAHAYGLTLLHCSEHRGVLWF